ncbi:sel1 repeat family protein [Alteromonas sp. KUL49]|uniref:tetratricopeptide repeat protein n=1 Tax=Alteromonas sp. KUL49 TaxID=2480798 RepID=UPI00102EF266|nr:sel1 repeat family protein [Alteromonas sp. KUL49]TAP35871.1 sel1 repeat family protein [Alteromonas sp. KUL49]GEA13254.1 hypothetical protein KUL49_36290 [Alteromonas sp. KUL49]
MRGLILALLSLLFISGDSGQYLPQLLANASSIIQREGPANRVYPLLWNGVSQDSIEAKETFVGYAKQQEQSAQTAYWLNKLVEQDAPEAAWALYQQNRHIPSYVKYLQVAAKGGVPEAQLIYAMSLNEPAQREFWLKEAAEKGFVAAQTALADWYLLQQQPQKAKPWLAKTASLDTQSAFKYGRLLWSEQSFDEAREWLNRSALEGNTQAKRFVSLINSYQINTPEQVGAYTWPEDKQCHQRIQLFATSLSTLARADDLYNKYQNDPRLVSLSLCVAPPVWLEQDILSCSDNFQGQGRLGCDITPLAPAIDQRNISHAVVVADQGKANINNGVMYLDLSDAYSVFVHELAHFAGFIDEYPLSRMAARRYCSDGFGIQNLPIQPPNIVFDGQLTYMPQSTLNQWVTLRPSVVIAESKTCDAIGIKAYKPSGEITFMEHHDSGVIPPLYLALWEAQLAIPEVQRPISMNLFQSFHAKGQQVEAGYWLGRYQIATKPITDEEHTAGIESAI